MTVIRRLAMGLLTAVLCLGVAAAEMTIRLKNGETYNLPFKAQQVDTIEFDHGQVIDVKQQLKWQQRQQQSPAARAAERERTLEDGGNKNRRSTDKDKPKAGQDLTARPPGILRVGPDRDYPTPSAAAAVAKDGDTVEIDAGVYSGDVARWRQNNLTLRGVGGRAHLKADGKAQNGKAIWVIRGDNITVENMEFSGTRVPSRNGAGIRFEGEDLTIRNSVFHNNEMGILTGHNPEGDILIENSSFYGNTVDYERFRRLGHNIYIGDIARFTLRNSHVHGAITGHNVKTRALHNVIINNRITDEGGGSSYLVDLVRGGEAYLIGNIFQQSAAAPNWTMVSFASRQNTRNDPEQLLYAVNNTFVNDRGDGFAIQNNSIGTAHLINNIIVSGTAVDGLHEMQNNLTSQSPGFVDRASLDYRLQPGSPAIDQGIDPGTAPDGRALMPAWEYRHPLDSVPRPRQGAVDIGAFEVDS